MDISREHYLNLIEDDLDIVPICVLLGPRQCGKTTLAHHYAKTYAATVKNPIHYFDLEDPTDLNKLENPKLTLEPLNGLIIMDEIQRRPEIFPYLRVLVDKKDVHLLLLGSASRDLLQQSSETLAGRVSYVELPPFSLGEVVDFQTLWLRGGFPRSFLAKNDTASFRWRQAYVRTYFERDLALLGMHLSPQDMGKMWHFLSQFHGNIINYAEMARFLNLSVPTVKKYMGLLEGTFMIRTLSPWFENISKRQVKSPKFYIRDSGMYHFFQNIKHSDDLYRNRFVGASFEGFAMEEVIKSLSLRSEDCFFWSTHQEAEIDLFTPFLGKRIGFEFKYSDKPTITKSMRIALSSLHLDHLFIVSPLKDTYSLEENVTVLSVQNIQQTVENVLKRTS